MSENLKKKKSQNSALYSTQWQPGTLEHLAISLVANNCTKLGKITENMLLIRGLAYINRPMWYTNKGQLISKCPYEKSVWTKYQLKYF